MMFLLIRMSLHEHVFLKVIFWSVFFGFLGIFWHFSDFFGGGEGALKHDSAFFANDSAFLRFSLFWFCSRLNQMINPNEQKFSRASFYHWYKNIYNTSEDTKNGVRKFAFD